MDKPADKGASPNEETSERTDSLARLLEMLEGGDAQTRGMVATAFSRVKDPATVEPLIGLLADEDEHVRSAAAQALGFQEDERAVGPLIDAAHNMEDESLRANALAALSRLAHPGSFNTAVAALFDLSDAVRKNAAVAVGKLHDARALEPLVMLLDDENPQVRANAAWALGEIGETGAVDALIARLDRELDAQARQMLFIALGVLATPEACERCLAEATTQLTTPNSRIAAMIGAVDAITQHLSDNAATVARQSDRLRPALLSSLAGADDNEERATAAWALGHLPDAPASHEAALAALIAALDDPYEWVVAYAVESLAILHDARAEKPLRQLAARASDADSEAPEDDGSHPDLPSLAAQAADVIAGAAPMPKPLRPEGAPSAEEAR